jgi:hypothetical protein
MMMKSVRITVIRQLKKEDLLLSYHNDICIGEMIRNICVNAGIDPDTIEGYTRNIIVMRKWKSGWKEWNYNPNQDLKNCTKRHILYLQVKELYS